MAAQAAIHERKMKGNPNLTAYPLLYQPDEQRAWVYFLTNQMNGILYVGVTNNLARRIYEHREAKISGFTQRYGLKMLVYYEGYPSITQAIAREKAIKNWPRAWKVKRVLTVNPNWNDLYGGLI